VRFVAIVIALLCVGCTSSSIVTVTSTAAAISPNPAVSNRVLFSPKHARVVGVVRAAEPPADDIRLSTPIILDACKIACPDVLAVSSEIRTLGSKTLVVVRCGHGPARAVRLINTGVTVPDLVGDSAHGLEDVGAFLRLDIDTSTRPAPGEESNTVVAQEPPGGAVVPFGSTLTVVVAN
jgi:hypothetical protein